MGGPRVYVAPVSHGVTLTLVLQAWAWLLITSHYPGYFSLEAEAVSCSPPVPWELAAQLTARPPPLTSPRPLAPSL